MDVLREQHQFTQARKGQPQNWYQFSSGFSDIAYRAAFVSREGRVVIELNIARRGKLENERLFDQLAERRSEIEDALGYALQWKRLDQAKACRIANEREGSIDDNLETLAEIEHWMVENLLAFKRAFGPHLTELLS